MNGSVRNCILITVDCLRADHLGCYGYSKPTTPFLDSLAARGTIYRNFFSNGPFTPAAVLSMLASSYPLDFGGLLPVPESALMLPQHLGRHGIRTAALSANAAVIHEMAGYQKGFDEFRLVLKKGWESERAGLQNWARNTMRPILARVFGGGRGFRFSRNLFYFLQYFGLVSADIPGVDAAQMTAAASSALARMGGSRFFLWLHYIDPHLPRISEAECEMKVGGRALTPHRRKFLNSLRASVNVCKIAQELEDITLMYDATVRRVDDALAVLWKQLEERGLAQETAVIVTADHGEELFEHKKFWHDARFYDSLLHIPFIMHAPGAVPRVEDSLASGIDVAPTICELLGIPVPNLYRGRSLCVDPRLRLPRRPVSTRASRGGVKAGGDDKLRPIISQAECDRSGNIFLDNLLKGSKGSKGGKGSKGERQEGMFRHAIRSRRYKYIWSETENTEEFYDLAADPGETKNNPRLAETQEMKRLIDELREFRSRQKAGVKEKEEAYLRYFFS